MSESKNGKIISLFPVHKVRKVNTTSAKQVMKEADDFLAELDGFLAERKKKKQEE
ncbi:hypothetical protein [Halobacillus sp. K22]|uniref:hypothetical protein n=1 Tax=Halobacillus sp. K22 TaxID=3457431 RepID=UPI003FCEDF4A